MHQLICAATTCGEHYRPDNRIELFCKHFEARLTDFTPRMARKGMVSIQELHMSRLCLVE
jgi:hypothetical protein